MAELNKEAEVETVLYRPEDKKVLVVGQFYGHPANVFSYEGSIASIQSRLLEGNSS